MVKYNETRKSKAGFRNHRKRSMRETRDVRPLGKT